MRTFKPNYKAMATLQALLDRDDLPTLDNNVPGKPRLIWPDEPEYRILINNR